MCSHHICPGSYRDWHLLVFEGSWEIVRSGASGWVIMVGFLQCVVGLPRSLADGSGLCWAMLWLGQGSSCSFSKCRPPLARCCFKCPPGSSFGWVRACPWGAVVLGGCPGGLDLGLPSPWSQQVLAPHQPLTITNDSD